MPSTVKETSALLKVLQKQVRKLWKEYQSKQTTVLVDQEEAYIASRPDMCPKRAARIFKNFKEEENDPSPKPPVRSPVQQHKRYELPQNEAPVASADYQDCCLF